MNTTKKETLTFESALKELESIVKTLEEGASSLDEGIGLYERGIILKKFCEDRLKNAKLRIEELSVKDGDPVSSQVVTDFFK